ASGFPERSIRQYVLEGMVPRPKYRGKDTLYGDAQLIALRAIAKLRKEQRMFRLAPLRAWFAGKSASEIEAFVTGVPVAAPAPAAPVELREEPRDVAPVVKSEHP